jgi:hypothetical protein
MDRAKVLFACTLAFSIALEFCVRYFGLWHTLWGHMDSAMHFWWGWNIFLGLVLFLRWTPYDALLGVFVWQMLWEAVEIVGDRFVPQIASMLDPFYFDGIKDTVFDIAGGACAWGTLALLGSGLVALHASPLRRWMATFLGAMVPGIALGALLTVRSGESASLFALAWVLCAAVLSGLLGFARSRLTRTRRPSA